MANRAGTDATQKVPAAVRPVFTEITQITRALCSKHLNAEYARLCDKLAAKLARKRPSPQMRGDREQDRSPGGGSRASPAYTEPAPPRVHALPVERATAVPMGRWRARGSPRRGGHARRGP